MDQLPEHEDAIRSCDILIIASHSQGGRLAQSNVTDGG